MELSVPEVSAIFTGRSTCTRLAPPPGRSHLEHGPYQFDSSSRRCIVDRLSGCWSRRELASLTATVTSEAGVTNRLCP